MSELVNPVKSQTRRRAKPQVSCTSCRAKKLKCDRSLPCKNCQRRSPGSCVYVSKTYSPQTATSAAVSEDDGEDDDYRQIHDRIRRLEGAVQNISSGLPASRAIGGISQRGQVSAETEFKPSATVATPTLASTDSEIRVIDTTNWEAVHREISAIGSVHCNTQGLNRDSSPRDSIALQPSLLLGTTTHVSLEQMINLLPSKSTTDYLVNTFTRASDLPDIPIHLPAFLADYKAFWDNPGGVSLPWLSILFSIIALGLQIVVNSEATVEGIVFAETASRQYVSRAAECLRASDYTKPTSRTVQAMLFLFFGEHNWLAEQHFQASLVLGLAIRLAMQLGYHRDPAHFDKMTVFEGEVRRRTWSHLVQLDLLFASYLGVPPHTNHRHCDTKLPANVREEDLFPSMTVIPPALSRDEPSLIGFLNYRAQSLVLLDRITEYTQSRDDSTSQQRDALGKLLEDHVNACPPWLRCSQTLERDSSETIAMNRAIEIDIVHQRARIVLNRRPPSPAPTDPDDDREHKICVEAATTILRHQKTLSSVSFAVDGLTMKNWRILAFLSQDFLLGAMILCTEVDRAIRSRQRSGFPDKDSDTELMEKHVELLNSCRELLSEGRAGGSRTKKGTQAIKVIVDRACDYVAQAKDNTYVMPPPSTPSHWELGTNGLPISYTYGDFDLSQLGAPTTLDQSGLNSHTISLQTSSEGMVDGMSTIYGWSPWEA